MGTFPCDYSVVAMRVVSVTLFVAIVPMLASVKETKGHFIFCIFKKSKNSSENINVFIKNFFF